LGSDEYVHIDLAGVSVFDAGSDTQVPRYGPVFAAMEKYVAGLVDQQKSPWSADALVAIGKYDRWLETPYHGIEDLLVAEIPEGVQRRFLERAAGRDDYPSARKYEASLDAEQVRDLVKQVLKARKGDNY